jgi:hypothetical protein
MVTSSASDEWAGLDADLATSEQRLTGIRVLRRPRLNHRVRVAARASWRFHDRAHGLVRSIDGHGVIPRGFYALVVSGDFVSAVARLYSEIHASLEGHSDVERLSILKKGNFRALSKCLCAFNDLKLWTDETLANLSTV